MTPKTNPATKTGLLTGGFSGGKRAGKATPSRAQWLALRPLRNPALEWSEQEGVVVLTIRRERNWKTRLLNVFVPLPDEKKIALDRIGTDVWMMLDGEQNVGGIVKALAKKYQIEPREAELSLQQYFKELGRRGYVGFWVESSEKPAETEKPAKADTE